MKTNVHIINQAQSFQSRVVQKFSFSNQQNFTVRNSASNTVFYAVNHCGSVGAEHIPSYSKCKNPRGLPFTYITTPPIEKWFESSHSDITVEFQMKRDPNRSPPICKAFSIQTPSFKTYWRLKRLLIVVFNTFPSYFHAPPPTTGEQALMKLHFKEIILKKASTHPPPTLKSILTLTTTPSLGVSGTTREAEEHISEKGCVMAELGLFISCTSPLWFNSLSSILNGNRSANRENQKNKIKYSQYFKAKGDLISSQYFKTKEDV